MQQRIKQSIQHSGSQQTVTRRPVILRADNHDGTEKLATHRPLIGLLSLAILSSLVFSAASISAPQNGTVVAGQGNINNVANTTNINQQSNTMVVDWSSFNVAPQETVNFNQPSASASALNRIYDQSPSQIFGAINANGRVFLSNPNGMVFGQNATVNVGALVATGLSISSDDFMNGNLHFNADNYTPGAIINHGSLSAASGGSVSLIGGQVTNTGYIVADYGQINLATGKQAVLNFDGDGLINISVSEDVITNMDDAGSSVSNTGSLQADGGTILLTAHTAKDVFTNAINNEGVITARRMENVGGEIYLAGNSGTTIHSGNIDVSNESGEGGSVFLLGDNVGVIDAATINASGESGGGTVLIGGDFQGNNNDIQNAGRTYAGADAVITADAVKDGDGGKVILWSDEITKFNGNISATGGSNSGNGGFVEVSGKQVLVYNGSTDISAINGGSGTLLLDPADIDIVSGSTDVDIDDNDAGADFLYQDQLASAVTSQLSENTLEAALVTGNVIVDTSVGTGGADKGDITVKAAIDWNTTNSLTLRADRNISIDATGSLISTAAADISLNATGSVTLDGVVTTNGGNFVSSGTTFNNTNGTVTTTGGAIDLIHTDDVTLGLLDAAAGNVTIAGAIIDEGTDSTSRNIISSGTVDLTATGRVGNTATATDRLDIDTRKLVVDAGDIVQINIVNDDVAGKEDLSDLTLSTTASYGADSEISADNLTFNVTESAGKITIGDVTDVSGLNFTLINPGNDILVGNIDVGAGSLDLTATEVLGTGAADIVASTVTLVASADKIGGATPLDIDASTAVNADSSAGGGDISINATSDLPVGIINAGSGVITLDASTAGGGNITLGQITTTDISNSSVTLKALGSIIDSNATGADITSNGRLVITSASGVGASGTLETNVVSIDISNSTSDDIKISNSGNLIVERAIQTLAGDIYLTSTGTITDTGAGSIIQTELLTTSSVGDTTLDETAYLIGSYNGTTNTFGTITLIDSAGGLDITGITSATDAVITTTGNLTQSGGIISAGTLTTTSTNGSTSLTSNNTLVNYDGTTTGTTKDLAITDAGGLNITAIDATGNADIITTGDLTQSGVISAITLTTVSTGGATNLSTSTNTIINFDGTTTGTTKDLAITDAGGLNITAISASGDADIITSGDLTQSGGVINAVALTTTSTDGSTDLTSNNTIASYNGTTTGTNKNLSVVDSTAGLNITDTGTGYGISSTGSVDVTSSNKLTISNAITSGADILLTADKMTINSTVNANTGSNDVSLQAGTNAINLSATAGDLVTDTLELSLTELNNITAAALTIGNNTSGNIIVSQALALSPANISAFHLVTGGTISDTGVGGVSGNINLAIESAGAVTLNGANNNVATLAVDAGSNNVTFVDSNLLTTGDVDGVFGIQGNDIVLTATAGNLVVTNGAAVNDIDAAGTVDLTVITPEQNLQIASSANVVGTNGTHTYIADNMQIDGNVDATGRSVSLTSKTNGNLIDLGVAISGAASTLELTTAELASITADKLTIGNSSAGTIKVTSAVTPSSVTELELVTGNAITDNSLVSYDITVNTLTATAVNGIGSGNAIETQVSILDAINSTSGNIEINNGISLDVSQLIQSTTGNITLRVTGQNNDINVNGAISTLNDSNISLVADDSVIFAAAGDLTAAGSGLIEVVANNTVTDGDTGDLISMDAGTVIDAGSGVVLMRSTGTNGGAISVGQVKTTSVSDASISLRSETSISDADASAANNITSDGRLFISSKTGVGSTADALETAVASIEITNASSGDINIDNSGSLTVHSAIQSTAGDIYLKSNGTITQTLTGVVSTPGLLSTESTGNTTLASTSNAIASYSGTTNTSGNITLFDNAGGLVITAIDSSGDANITTNGDLSQSGSVISAATLTTQSNSGSTTLDSANTITAFNGTTNSAGKDLSIVDSTGSLNVSGLSVTGVTSVSTIDTLTLSGPATGGGDISFTADDMALASTIDAGINRVSLQTSTNGVQIDLGSLVDATPATLELSTAELGNITAAELTIGNALSGAITVTTSVTPTAADLHLVSGSTVTASGAGVGIAGNKNLAIEAGGAVIFDGDNNDVATLAIDAGSNNITFIDNNLLTTGDVDGVESITGNDIVLTASSGGLVVGASVAADEIAAGGSVSLSALAAEQNIQIAAGTNINATGGNHIYIADNIQVDGTVDATGHAVSIKPSTNTTAINLGTNASAINTLEVDSAELANITADTLILGNADSGDITISSAIAPATIGDLQFVTGAGIVDANAAGVDITAGTLSIVSVNGIGDGDALETAVSSIDLVNSSFGNIEIVNTGTLAITQAIQSAMGDIIISATSNADADISVNGVVSTASNGSITLTAEDSIIQVAAGDITASGAGSVNLTANNDSTAAGDSGDVISMADGAVINAGSGTVSLSTSGSGGGDITLAQIITTNTSNASVSLNTESGIVDADASTGNDVTSGGRLLITSKTGVGASDAIETAVASIDISNATSGDIELSNTGNLSVQKAVQTTAGNIILSSTGSIIETGSGTISTDTLITSSTGNTTLNSANNTVASFAATTNTSGNISLIDSAGGLDISSINSAGNANITTTGNLTQSGVISAATLTTASNTGDTILTAANTLTAYNGRTNTSGNITINDSNAGLNITGINSAGDATITVNGNLTQTGAISADTLTTTSNSGSTTLNAANTISTFKGTSNTSGNVSITDSTGGLIITEINSAGDASITTTGNLTQTGVIVASELTTTSNTGNTVLTAANVLDAYNGSTNISGDITLFDNAGGLDITGIDAAGDASITTTGSLTQTGAISGAKLTTVSNNGSTVLNAANTIAAYDGTTNTSGDITIRDTAGGLDITALSSAGNATITTTGNLTQSGIISADTLTTVSNSGNTTLTAANTFATYNGSSNTSGNIAITDSAGGLVISGIDSAGDATVTTTGNLTQSGPITAATLITVSNSGDTVLDNAANSIAAYSGTTNTSGNLTFINSSASALDIVGISAAGNVQLTTDAIAVNGNVVAGSNRVTIQTLTAGNAIDLGSVTDVAADTLEISNAELSRITAVTLTIGDANAGDFNVTQDVTVNSNALHIITAGNVQSAGGGIIGGNQLAIESGGSIVLIDASTDISTLAAVATQDITIVNATATTIGTVDGVSGISGNDISITNTNGNLILDNAITANAGGDVAIALQGAGAALVTDTAGENITSSTGDITISASALTLANGIISSTGNLVLDTAVNDTTIGVGDASTGDFNLDAAELALLQDGFGSITIGNSTSGDVNVQNVTFNERAIINGADIILDGMNVASNDATINSAGFIRGVSNAAVDLTANNVSLTSASGGIGLAAAKLDVSAASILNADTSASNSAINISSPVDMKLGVINAGTGTVALQTAGMIIDAAASPVIAGTLNLNAVTGIANSNELNVVVNILSANNSGVGDINISDPDNLTITSLSNDTGDVTISTGNNISLADGATISTVNAGGISFFAVNQITSAGTSSINSAGGFTFNKALELAGTTSITTAEQLNITENITTSSGALSLDSTAISFGSGVVLTAADSITIANAVTTANGDLSLVANGIELLSQFTINNGNLILNAGNDDLSINAPLSANNGNITIAASDIDIAPTGLIDSTDIVSLSDSGNGMALGGTVEPGIFNISLNEYELITASAIDINTQNGLTLKDDFQTNTSISPLTINANELKVQKAGTVLGLLGNLDLAETAVTAASDFTINVAGTFDMNNSVTTNGQFVLSSAAGITMGDPSNNTSNTSTIVSNNNDISVTANGGDVLLGYLNAGSGNVEITSGAGSILNNNGIFTNVLSSNTNVLAANLDLDANLRIGASSTDAVTVNVNPKGVIVLDFNAEKAFLNNIQNTRIVNNGSGDVAIGLIFSSKIIAIGHNVGLNSQQTEEVPSDEDSDQKLMSVMGGDYSLAELGDEEDDVSTLNAIVPVMIRTKDGWEFKAPSRNLNEKNGREQKVDWM